ncbi:MAG TPA: hypothetical protein VFA15_04530, partial [Nitrososphaera sp.]|nr:hypothetical protein [Nitrososphaera sp.]
IIALQLECCNPDCRVRIALEPSRWDKEKLPSRCPSCGSVWWATRSPQDSPSVENAIHGFLENGKKLVTILRNPKRKEQGEFYRLGCNLTLEIRSGPEN